MFMTSMSSIRFKIFSKKKECLKSVFSQFSVHSKSKLKIWKIKLNCSCFWKVYRTCFFYTFFFCYNWLICAKLFIRSTLFSPICVVVIKRETWKKYESYAYDLITCNIGSRHFLPMRCALASIKKWRKNIHVCMKSFS